jgi:L-threonylcarbamoyladenylate synthase
LPLVVTAQTGFVGIRSPKSKYARQLIERSGRPIGAPSANLFSHVSPTSPVHVFNDFYDQEITIVDG